MPVTQSGGISDVAIATPAICSCNFLNHSERNAMIPLANAMNRSIIVGEILAYISDVSVATGVIWVIIVAIPTDNNTLIRLTIKPFL